MKLVGILNITPDSFSDGGKYLSGFAAIERTATLFAEGADIVDVGAESTNPKSMVLEPSEEQVRLAAVLPDLIRKYPGKISLDTYHPETLKWALEHGTVILNDVSGLHSTSMCEVAAEHELTVIIGHLPKAARGIPIASHAIDPIDNAAQVRDELLERAYELEKFGIKHDRIILDPNIGFGKTMKLNWQLLEFAKLVPNYPVMIGHSNKRFLGCDSKTGELLKDGQELRYTPKRNREAAQIATESGAAYLRVHNPKIYG